MTKEKAMLNLAIKTTFAVSTDDLGVFCDPPLTFQAIGRVNDTLHRELVAWGTAGYPADQTTRFIPRLFLSVAQNGVSYPLSTADDAQALREAVGDEFLANLVESFWDYEFSYFKKKRLASASLSPQSTNGSGQEPPT